MTPRRLDPDSLHEKLAHLRQLLSRLEHLGPLTRERLEREEVERAAGERWLTMVVEAAVSINLHVAAARLGRVGRDYTESFKRAAEAGLIDADLAATLAPSAATRNQLVHGYLDIDLDLLAAAFAKAPEQYAHYVRQAAGFVQKVAEEEPGQQ